MSKIVRLSDLNPQNDPWYKKAWVIVVALLSFTAILFGSLSDGYSFYDRFSGVQSSTTENNSDSTTYIDTLIVNAKPIKLHCSSITSDIANQKKFEYSFEVETSGIEILLEDNISLINYHVDGKKVDKTRSWDPINIELITSEVSQKYLSRNNPKVAINLIFSFNLKLNHEYSSPKQTSLFNIGNLTISIPYKINNKIINKEQKINLLIEVEGYLN